MNQSMGGTAQTVRLSAADCALLREVCYVAAGEAPFVFDEARYCRVEALGAHFGALAGAVIGADLDAAPSGQAAGC